MIFGNVLGSRVIPFAVVFLLLCQQISLSRDASKQDVIELIQASTRGDTEKVQALLNRGVDVNSKHPLNWWTALMAASLYGRVETVQLLVLAGADLDLKDKNRSTALMKAVQTMPEKDESDLLRRKAKIIEILLNAGANPSLEDKFEGTPWQVAIYKKETPLVDAFEQHHVKGVKETKLMLAIAAKDIPTAKRLLNEGANVNYRDDSGANSLSEAVLAGNVELLRLVIQANAKLDAKFDKGWTALMIATHRNQTDLVRVLLESGANPLVRNDAGITAIEIAEFSGNSAIAELLRTAAHP